MSVLVMYCADWNHRPVSGETPGGRFFVDDRVIGLTIGEPEKQIASGQQA